MRFIVNIKLKVPRVERRACCLSSRELNRFYERDGHVWAGRARVEEILDDNSAEMMLMYDACNPVKDGMVGWVRIFGPNGN